MNLLNFIAWLSAGAVIGWFAHRMVEAENRRIQKPISIKVTSSEKS